MNIVTKEGLEHFWEILGSKLDEKSDSSSLATVATSGSYNDLEDSPTIPTVSDDYNSDSSSAMSGKAVSSAISNKADLNGAIFTGDVTVTKIITSTGLEIY